MITLTRKEETENCTPGKLMIGSRVWATMELPDRNNKPFVSCIPLGIYDLVPYKSPKYGDTFVAVNEDLNVYHSLDSEGRPSTGRYKCLYFHRGNYPHNFNGCGGVGKTWFPDKEMITNTAITCKNVNQLIQKEGSLKLEIRSWWE